MKIVYMGTPDFAVPALQALYEAGHEIAGVVTRPDAKSNRGKKIHFSPVKEKALELGIPVFQPQKLKGNEEFQETLAALAPEVIVVAAYGRILPASILQLPARGCLNIHGSLLPRFRGAAPIQAALLEGDEMTGITIMRMDAGMDTGDILAQREIPIGPEDNADSVFRKMGETGSRFILEVLPEIENGTLDGTPQDHELATYAPPIEKEEGSFSFESDARGIVHLIHGVSTWPVAYFMYEDKKIKVADASFSEMTGKPGEILSVKPLTIAAKDGAVVLRKVIPEGGKPMDGTAWINGRRKKTGENLYKVG